MTDLFAAADKIVVGEEGAHGNQALDSGGDTVFGIARNYHPNEPWPPTWQRAQDIRRTEYWLAHKCDQMPWMWALGVYDAAINQTGHGLRALQDELGLTADGVIGPATLAAVLRASEAHFTLFMARRILAYASQPLWSADGKGWAKRALEIHHAAMTP